MVSKMLKNVPKKPKKLNSVHALILSWIFMLSLLAILYFRSPRYSNNKAATFGNGTLMNQFSSKKLDPIEISLQASKLLLQVQEAKFLTFRNKYVKKLSMIEQVLFEFIDSLGKIHQEEEEANVVTDEKSPEVCGEIYKEGIHSRWVRTRCNARSLNRVLSMILISSKMVNRVLGVKKLKNIIKNVSGYKGLKVYLVVHDSDSDSIDLNEGNNVGLKVARYYTSPFRVVNKIVKAASTPYLFIAEDLENFSRSDARLEHLVKMLIDSNSMAVGGSSRDPSGHWTNNCLQAEMLNYSLLLRAGYDRSEYECLHCDVLTGPFVVRTNFLKMHPFHTQIPRRVVFYDSFLRMLNSEHKFMVCPDSMFYSSKSSISADDSSVWKHLAVSNQLNAIKLPDGQRLSFGCADISSTCKKSKSIAQSPCCLRELSQLVVDTMDMCEENGIFCELMDETLLSAVKMNTIHPWGIDISLAFLSTNFTALEALGKSFKEKRYKMKIHRRPELHKSKARREAIEVKSEHWSIVLLGHSTLDSYLMKKEGMEPTRILFDGRWLISAKNPGKVVRNRFGHQIYRHIEPLDTSTDDDGDRKLKSKNFMKCRIPGHHACLDQYSIDGNLQFGDISL